MGSSFSCNSVDQEALKTEIYNKLVDDIKNNSEIRQLLKGDNGIDGTNGKDGSDGADGVNGSDGVVDYTKLVEELVKTYVTPVNIRWRDLSIVTNEVPFSQQQTTNPSGTHCTRSIIVNNKTHCLWSTRYENHEQYSVIKAYSVDPDTRATTETPELLPNLGEIPYTISGLFKVKTLPGVTLPGDVSRVFVSETEDQPPETTHSIKKIIYSTTDGYMTTNLFTVGQTDVYDVDINDKGDVNMLSYTTTNGLRYLEHNNNSIYSFGGSITTPRSLVTVAEKDATSSTGTGTCGVILIGNTTYGFVKKSSASGLSITNVNMINKINELNLETGVVKLSKTKVVVLLQGVLCVVSLIDVDGAYKGIFVSYHTVDNDYSTLRYKYYPVTTNTVDIDNNSGYSLKTCSLDTVSDLSVSNYKNSLFVSFDVRCELGGSSQNQKIYRQIAVLIDTYDPVRMILETTTSTLHHKIVQQAFGNGSSSPTDNGVVQDAHNIVAYPENKKLFLTFIDTTYDVETTTSNVILREYDIFDE
ncbi:hypothetical protein YASMINEVIRUS_1363 [Yasminevirus sp. GU-2018]|uniref:Uncharacterized protein n=1 Tax=Yasminevirus sp. GU-2018 TaxID=2420051 RepID=A0A5K0UB02_9VIRU|nr:hypothetical protein YASMINEVIRUS_1363 [Yasminevirus sp. GU-2018]